MAPPTPTHDQMLPECIAREARRDEQLNRIEAQVAEMHEIICGDGNPKRGLADRVSVLETRWWVFSLLVMLLTAVTVGAKLWTALTSSPAHP